MKKAIASLLLVAASSTACARPSFMVPDRIYAAVGHECNVYKAKRAA